MYRKMIVDDYEKHLEISLKNIELLIFEPVVRYTYVSAPLSNRSLKQTSVY
jgi:hypothetical protein